jgi:hypothetical protein
MNVPKQRELISTAVGDVKPQFRRSRRIKPQNGPDLIQEMRKGLITVLRDRHRNADIDISRKRFSSK